MQESLDFLIQNRIQVFSIIGSATLIVFILKLIKRKKLKEEYSLLWLGCGITFFLVSLFKPLLELVAQTLGIIYAPAALLLVLIIGAFFILIQFSVVISKLSESNKNLTQEIGILKAEIKNLEQKSKEQS
ncbi:MAG: hypothetical protein B0W54_21280 [Cellvibrio sp. 79]|nr:MAG: hypothetical protein B0W54_21280 [Cellvibrio sp. 79]